MDADPGFDFSFAGQAYAEKIRGFTNTVGTSLTIFSVMKKIV